MCGRLFVISAPSGTGKTTLIKEVRRQIQGLAYCVSHTTRKPRQGENNGVNYYFVSRETFEAMISKGEFIEWAEVYGDYYGTSVRELQGKLSRGHDVLLDLDPQGAKNVRHSRPDAVLIFILPPSMQELRRRLEGRGTDDREVVALRLERAESEIAQCRHYDYIVINDRLEDGVKEIVSIIMADRCRLDRRLEHIKQTFGLSI